MGNVKSKEKEETSKYPPINYKKIKKSEFRIGADIDFGMKDFETGMTFGKNHVSEMYYSENNQHLKLITCKEESDTKDKIISSLLKNKREDE